MKISPQFSTHTLFDKQNILATSPLNVSHRNSVLLLYSENILKQRGTIYKNYKNEMGWECGTYECGEGVMGSWGGNRRERDHWGDLGVNGCIILEWMSRRWDVCIWTGLDWPRIETGGGRL